MLTYSNDPAMKAEFIAEVQRHTDLDHLVKGNYGKSGPDWRGCAVGCAAVSWAAVKGVEIFPGDHAALEREGLYPEWLARLEDTIFEWLPDEKAMQWPLRLSAAIPSGADVEPVKWRFCAFLMRENIDRVLGLDIPETLQTQVADVIRGVLALFAKAISAGEWDNAAAESAVQSAVSAAEPSAESAAGYVAESAALAAAWSAVGSAESAAWSAAWSAESAAWSAAWSTVWSAGSAAYERYADELIALLEHADTAPNVPTHRAGHPDSSGVMT